MDGGRGTSTELFLCKQVHTFNTGVDAIVPVLKKPLTDRSIPFTCTRGVSSSTLAEYTLAQIFHFAKRNRELARWYASQDDILESSQIGDIDCRRDVEATLEGKSEKYAECDGIPV